LNDLHSKQVTINTTEFEIGARGWLFPQWVGQFYPDDLPEEWWFSYYSNQFHTVLVPADLFCRVTVEVVEDWVEYCHDDFRFYIELAANTNWQLLRPKFACFKQQLAGIVIRLDPAVSVPTEQLEQLTVNALGMAPTYVDHQFAGLIDGQKMSFTNSELGCICDFQALQSDWIKPFERAVVLTSMANDQDPRQMRKILDSCLSNNSLVVYSLFFASLTPQVNDMETMQTLYTLWA